MDSNVWNCVGSSYSAAIVEVDGGAHSVYPFIDERPKRQNPVRKKKMNNDSNSNHRVGYGRPPKEHQFQPGQSGNPFGRPKGARSFKSDLRDELGEVISVSDVSIRPSRSPSSGPLSRRCCVWPSPVTRAQSRRSSARAPAPSATMTARPTSRRRRTGRSCARSILPDRSVRKTAPVMRRRRNRRKTNDPEH